MEGGRGGGLEVTDCYVVSSEGKCKIREISRHKNSLQNTKCTQSMDNFILIDVFVMF
jgi:hypothetical protein